MTPAAQDETPAEDTSEAPAAPAKWKRFFSREFLRYLGPGFLVTVGFIDPGNWATNIAGGSDFRYQLLWVITLSTVMLILLQNMSARLGIITGRSLASNIRDYFPRWLSNIFGSTIVVACFATDVAELLGGAIGFNLLFGFPIVIGALLTVIIEVVVIVGQRYHHIERLIIAFLAVIAGCYLVELALVDPEWTTLLPRTIIPTVNSQNIYVAMGMLGAVVMPHNIYLHSNVIQSREWHGDEAQKRKLISFELADTTLAMLMGWLVNSAMIVVAAAVFWRNGLSVVSIEQAAETLRPLAGNLAYVLFALALLLAGIGSSITSSMAEVNVITGFLGKPEDPKSLIYRVGIFVTAIPAFLVIALKLDSFKVLILSQVALSIQLPFTIIPVIILARSRKVMGRFRSGNFELTAGIIVAAIIIALNGYLLYSTVIQGW